MRLTDRFGEALVFAEKAHREQVRKETDIPYVAHLLAVASIVLEHGGDEDQAIAALLHDAVEDQGGDAMGLEIRDRFGERVYSIVMACTDATVIPKPPWRARKEAYIAAVPGKRAEALLVAMADKLHNAHAILEDHRRIGDAIWDRFNGGHEGTVWYYRSLADAFASLAPGDLADRLKRAADEMAATLKVRS
jgi:(p)ppGpp synthase/HD superfamily hydrolase